MIIFLHILFSSSQKFSLRVLLKFCLIFCHFQLGVPYKVLHVYFHLPLTQTISREFIIAGKTNWNKDFRSVGKK